ncbi:hypothetical protein GWI33_005328 [Rhynchophorus ferrugineus]|uniref:Uncharacterized protein n=1 Tax=Rhynchophorus ferrugineus TaxID=354439 RepID=A0A834MJN5_RHYFE|nr:hypothetical protein GWI33_005328 [Rhynchophorus ferrugineus]
MENGPKWLSSSKFEENSPCGISPSVLGIKFHSIVVNSQAIYAFTKSRSGKMRVMQFAGKYAPELKVNLHVGKSISRTGFSLWGFANWLQLVKRTLNN